MSSTKKLTLCSAASRHSEQEDNNNSRPPRQMSRKNSDISSSTTEGGEKTVTKRLPPIKAPVGLAKGPDLKNCKSKIGSLHNIQHTPTSGGVTIPTQKLKWSAKSKVGSLENKQHKPAGGNLKLETRKLEWKTESKIQSLQNVHHKPGGGNVKIFNETYVEKPTAVGSLMKKPVTSKATGNGTNQIDDHHSSSSRATNKKDSDPSKSLSKSVKGLTLMD